MRVKSDSDHHSFYQPRIKGQFTKIDPDLDPKKLPDYLIAKSLADIRHNNLVAERDRYHAANFTIRARFANQPKNLARNLSRARETYNENVKAIKRGESRLRRYRIANSWGW